LSTERKSIKHTRGAKQKAVASRERRSEDTGIDEMRESRDARTINGNNERRLNSGSGSGAVEQIWIIIRYKHPNNEDAKDLWKIFKFKVCVDEI